MDLRCGHPEMEDEGEHGDLTESGSERTGISKVIFAVGRLVANLQLIMFQATESDGSF